MLCTALVDHLDLCGIRCVAKAPAPLHADGVHGGGAEDG
jgi:hypothetical protein